MQCSASPSKQSEVSLASCIVHWQERRFICIRCLSCSSTCKTKLTREEEEEMSNIHLGLDLGKIAPNFPMIPLTALHFLFFRFCDTGGTNNGGCRIKKEPWRGC